MRGRSAQIIGLVALALAGSLRPAVGMPGKGTSAVGTAPEKQAASVAAYRLRDAKLAAGEVARVGEKKVLAADVARRVGSLRKQAGTGHNEPERLREVALSQILDELVLPEYLMKEARLAKDPRIERIRTLYELLYLGNIYEREKIRPRVVVSETEIAAMMPRSREERRMRLLLLPDEETEARVRADAAAGKAFADLVDRYSRTTTPLRGDLGFTFKSGIFFTSDVEDYLWSLPVGALSRRVDTQIGPGIVVVEEVRKIGEKEWERMRSRNRDQLAQVRQAVFVKGVVDRHLVELDQKAFLAAATTMLAEDRFTDRVVGSVDGIAVYFHDVDRIIENSLQDVLMKAGPEEIAARYADYCRDILGPRLALGLEARSLGISLGKKEKDSVQRLVGKAILRVALQDVIKDVKVTDQDVVKAYEASNERLAGAAQVRLGVIVTESLDLAMKAVDEYQHGTHFALLVAQYSRDAKTKQKGGEIGWVSSELLPPEVGESLVETAPGEFFPVFKTPEGYQAVLLMEKKQVQTAPLSQVRPAIRRRLLRDARQQAIDARFGAIRVGMQVDVDRAQLQAIPITSGGLPGTSPHGGH